MNYMGILGVLRTNYVVETVVKKNKVSGMEIGGVGCNVSFNLTGLCCNNLLFGW